jgi:uncharacterized membrane protein
MDRKKINLWLGIVFLALLLVSFFIKIPIESGSNYKVFSPLLGIIIFNNPIILGIYILISLILIISGLKGKIKFV